MPGGDELRLLGCSVPELLRAGFSSAAAPGRKRKAQEGSRIQEGKRFFCSWTFPLFLPFTFLLLPYLITLSALARISGEMVTPICFAVLRLITVSKILGCSTGRS